MEKKFIEREWNEDIKGELDEEGFFTTPNGSFWDPDYVYFNREGYDKHGGYYDDDLNYIPGEGWDEVNKCYFDEDYENDYDEFYDKKDNKDYDDIIDQYEYENYEDDILEGENENFDNDPEIETIQIFRFPNSLIS